MARTIGIDIGGTKIAAAICDGARTRQPIIIPTPKTKAQTVAALKQILTQLDPGAKLPIGIGVPGQYQKTRIVHLPHASWLDGLELRSALRLPRARTLVVENDARCFTLAQATYGPGKGMPMTVGITIGTGLGGGIAINGVLWRGAWGVAGEFGHWSYPMGSEMVQVEEQLSGPAIAKRHREHGGTEHLVQDIWKSHSPAAKKTRAEIERIVALFVYNIHMALNPNIIVLGGGASHPAMCAAANKHLGENTVHHSTLAHAGVVGAALAVHSKTRSKV